MAFAFFTPVAPPAFCKMRTERLSIVPGGGDGKRAIDITIEIAQTREEKALGLMFRTSLPDGEGMLFPYPAAGNITMWMHNTYIPLDMLFIKPDGVIYRIEESAEPNSDRVISAGADVSAVLELAGGAAARLGIKAGDRVRHPFFDAKKSN